MRPQPRYQPGDKIGGRYQVHQALMGGMSEVYLCLDLETIQPLALKTFQQRFLTNPKLRAAFENEVATWVALEKHPNIVRCFYMEILDNQPFMFLEWIASDEGRGTDLRSWLRHGPLDLRLALDFTIDICRGMIHAQEKQPGIVHRDLKPENILVAQGRLAKITDWGLARVVQEAELEITDVESETDGRQSLLGADGIVGTPPYMAPEQWLGEVLDARTDIYAVGCILYEMLTREWPFQATTLDGLRRQHFEADIPNLADSQPVPGSLDTLLAHCLAKQREERFTTVNDLLQELSLICQQQFSETPRLIATSGEFTAADYTNRGLTYQRLQRYDEALADHNRAIQLDPTLAHAYNNRGLTYDSLQRYDEALADFDRAIQPDPALADTYIIRGSTYVDLQRYDEALADCNRVIQLDPTYAMAYSNRGNIHADLQRYDKALADFDRAIQLDPALAQAYSNRGTTYADLQRYDEALADFSQTIQLDPNFAVAYYNRGLMYHALHRHHEALADYSRAIHLDPTDAMAYSDRGNTYAELQRYDEALADFGRAIHLNPTLAQAYYNRGVTHADLERYDEALTDFDRAIHLDSTLAQAYYNRGTLYVALQRYDEALADLSRAIQLDPTDATLYTSRGTAYSGLQWYDEAVADFSRAIQLDPTDAIAYFNIGALLGNRGQWREALPYFEKAAQLGYPRGAHHAAQARQMVGKESAKEQPEFFSRLFKKRKR